MSRPKIVVVGSANIDIVVNTSVLPFPGETVLGKNYYTSPGGKGANQAVAAARAGADVCFIGKVGEDDFGNQLLSQLRQEKVDMRYVHSTGEAASGVALIIVDKVGENQIVVAEGANVLLTPKEVEAAEEVFNGADFCLVQLEIPINTVSAAISMANKHKVPVIFNPAPIQQKLRLRKLLPKVDYAVLNGPETTALTGVGVDDETDAMFAAKSLEKMGPDNVVITLGAKGAMLNCGGVQLIEGYPTRAVDTVGAGDVFCGTFAVGLAEKMGFAEAVSFACAAASISVTRDGAQPSFPSRSEIDKLMKGRRKK